MFDRTFDKEIVFHTCNISLFQWPIDNSSCLVNNFIGSSDMLGCKGTLVIKIIVIIECVHVWCINLYW